MSTPPEQYIPPEFQDVIDLPTGIDQPALDKAKRRLAAAKAQIASSKKQMDASKKRLADLQKQANKKGLSKQQRAALLNKIRAESRTYATHQGFFNTATSQEAISQRQIYEIGGEFDKLLTGNDRDAFLAVKSLFNQFGLGSLASKIYDYVKEGYGADTIGLLLQDTKEYKERFKANDARAKAGLAVLSPAEYLAAESAYRQILESSGLPKGFYDNPADFQRWIAGDVSPTEIKSRVDMAMEAVNKTDPNYRGALFQMYGVGEGALAAYFLDRQQAEPILKKQAAASAIGAAALRRGFGLNTLDMESYAALGITSEEAEAAYARISDSFESMMGLAGRYGTTWTQRDAEQEVFMPGATGSGESAFEKGKRLRSQERAAFAGGRGSSSQGLAAGYRQT